MYQSPGTMEMLAGYHQDELLREARNARLAREAKSGHDGHTSAEHRVIAAAIAVLMLLTMVAVI